MLGIKTNDQEQHEDTDEKKGRGRRSAIGRSTESLEAAIAEAVRSFPGDLGEIVEAKVKHLRVEITAGTVSAYSVELKADVPEESDDDDED
jgi:flavin-binding protein dodecin